MHKVIPGIIAVILIVLTFWFAGLRQKGLEERPKEVAVSEEAERDAVIIVGSVSPDDPEGEAEEFQPFIDYVASHLSGYGIKKGRVVVTSTMAEMALLHCDNSS